MASILSVATTASAVDLTNPFYLPYKGQFGSITTVGTKRYVSKNKVSHTKSKQLLLQEKVQVGLTDSLALTGTIGNTSDKWRATWYKNGQKNRDLENIQWDAGLAWNILKDKTRLQVSANYGQDRLKKFDGDYKYITTEAKAGYQFSRLLPYITGAVEIPIAQKSGTKGIAGDKFIYTTKAGIYQGSCEVWALDTGIRLSYDENKEERIIAAEAEASYYLTDTATLGIYGSYALDGKSKYHRDVDDISVGARLRMFF